MTLTLVFTFAGIVLIGAGLRPTLPSGRSAAGGSAR
jgi:hypothetical protein